MLPEGEVRVFTRVERHVNLGLVSLGEAGCSHLGVSVVELLVLR